MSESALANYENGIRYPDVDTMMHIADYFHISVDYLIGHTDNPCPIDSLDTDLSFIKTLYKIPNDERMLYIQLMQIAVEANELKLKEKAKGRTV